MKNIFKKAQKQLTHEEMGHWIFFAYGVMQSHITNSPKSLFTPEQQIKMTEDVLLKGINQELEARIK